MAALRLTPRWCPAQSGPTESRSPPGCGRGTRTRRISCRRPGRKPPRTATRRNTRRSISAPTTAGSWWRGRWARGFASSMLSRASSVSERVWQRVECFRKMPWPARSTRSKSAPTRSPPAGSPQDAMSPPRHAGKRRIARRSSPGYARKSGSISRSSRAPKRRGSSLPAALRCSIRAFPMRSFSISAEAPPKSSGCGSGAGAFGEGPRSSAQCRFLSG